MITGILLGILWGVGLGLFPFFNSSMLVESVGRDGFSIGLLLGVDMTVGLMRTLNYTSQGMARQAMLNYGAGRLVGYAAGMGILVLGRGDVSFLHSGTWYVMQASLVLLLCIGLVHDSKDRLMATMVIAGSMLMYLLIARLDVKAGYLYLTSIFLRDMLVKTPKAEGEVEGSTIWYGAIAGIGAMAKVPPSLISRSFIEEEGESKVKVGCHTMGEGAASSLAMCLLVMEGVEGWEFSPAAKVGVLGMGLVVTVFLWLSYEGLLAIWQRVILFHRAIRVVVVVANLVFMVAQAGWIAIAVAVASLVLGKMSRLAGCPKEVMLSGVMVSRWMRLVV